MRQACACMMPRNRSRAAGSSRAGPCRVSMKPVSAASGVRSSWLTLATKSARISSTRRIGERSWTVMTTTPVRVPPPASAAGEMNASEKRVEGNRDENSIRCALSVRMAERIASTSSGMRSAIEAGSPRRSAGAMAIASVLNANTRPSGSSTTTGSGMPETAASSRATSCELREPSYAARAASVACGSSSRVPSRRLSRPIQPWSAPSSAPDIATL